MLGLFAIPLLLGVALLVGALDNGDDDNEETTELPETPEVDEQTVSDGYIGTNAPEWLRADTQGGYINGGGGADTITGSDQSDGLLGGSGDDLIHSGDGNDVVSGDAGNDRVFLEAGNDEYTPDDTPANTAGDDYVNGGRGNDTIVDLLGSNRLVGSAGNDVLVAFDGLSETGTYDTASELGTTDTLSGGFGNDILAGDNGDEMEGFVGDDTFYVTDDEDADLDAVHISDFVTDEDTLVVVQLDGLASTGALDFIATNEGVSVAYEGRAVAFLEGLSAADIPGIRVSLSSLDGLEQSLNA